MNHKKLITIFMGIITITLVSCNNTGSNTVNTNNAQSTSKIASNAEENIVYLSDNIVNLSFTESAHSITPNEQWGGVSSYGETGLKVLANREDSTTPYEWLNSQNYGGSDILMESNNFEKNSFNFAFTGDMSFDYEPNAKHYICRNVAVAQVHIGSHNRWIFYSNIAPGLAAIAAESSSK